MVYVATNRMVHIVMLRLVSALSYLFTGAWLFVSYYWVSFTVSSLSQRDLIINFYNSSRLVTGVYIIIAGIHVLGVILELGVALFLVLTFKKREEIRLRRKVEEANRQDETAQEYEVSSEGL